MRLLPLILLLAVGCAGVRTTHETRSADAARAPLLTAPLAEEGFQLVWEDGLHGPEVAVLLDEYARVTGQKVMMTAETRQVVQKKHLDKAGSASSIDVAAEEVQEVTEALLSMHQIALIPSTAPGYVTVISLETQERNFVRRNAIYVPPEELDAWRTRAATLVTTSLELPNTDVRTLSNSLRTMLTDANTQQIIPVGNSNTLLLTGFAPDVHAFVGMLQRIDAASSLPATEGEGEGGGG